MMYVIEVLIVISVFVLFFFFKQKTAYEMRISDWSSDVCSSDLVVEPEAAARLQHPGDLPVEARLVGDVHGGVLSPHQVEGRRGEGQEIGRASCRERVCQYV